MTKIKICGLTRTEDVMFCELLGVDFVGFVFVESSPRFVRNPEIFQVRTKAKKVAVMMNQKLEPSKIRFFDFVQFHGFEDETQVRRAKDLGLGVIKAIFPEIPDSVKLCERIAEHVDYFLVDSSRKLSGGSGRFSESALLSILDHNRIFGKDFFLAGALTPSCVELYIRNIRPFGLDVSSGVEESPGVKSREKIAEFVERVRRTDELLEKNMLRLSPGFSEEERPS